MATFRTYPKIAKTLGALPPGAERARWVAVEKIHGSNFSFGARRGSDELRYFRRSGLIGESEIFFGFRSMLPRIEPHIVAAVSAVFEERPGAKEIHIYGELYGGIHPHRPRAAGVKPVQLGPPFYSDQHEFAAFDLAVDGEFVDFEEALRIFDEAGLPHTRPVLTGELHECLELRPEFFSRIGEDRHGLPPVDENHAEGYVVRPLREFRTVTKRAMVKNKSRRFLETDSKPAREPREARDVRTAAGRAALEALALAITQARLNNIVSKHGDEIGPHKCAALLVEDALDDFDWAGTETVDHDEWRAIRGELHQAARAVVADSARLAVG